MYLKQNLFKGCRNKKRIHTIDLILILDLV